MAGGPTAGWYADPHGRHEHRWWDGSTWTDNVSDAGTIGTDRITSGAAATTASPVAGAAVAGGQVGFSTPSGSNRSNGKVVAILAGAAIVVILVVLVTRGGGSDRRDDLVDSCVADSSDDLGTGSSARDDCECVIDELLDDGYSVDELEEFDEGSRVNDGLDPEFRDDIVSAARTCELL